MPNFQAHPNISELSKLKAEKREGKISKRHPKYRNPMSLHKMCLAGIGGEFTVASAIGHPNSATPAIKTKTKQKTLKPTELTK